MKAFKILIAAIIVLATFQSTIAQSDKSQRTIGIKTATLKIKGTCSMDKRRIETAANSVNGIKSASWNEYTEVLTVTYSVFNKDVADSVQKKIASIGYDTEKYKATNEAYNNLPCCCYKRSK